MAINCFSTQHWARVSQFCGAPHQLIDKLKVNVDVAFMSNQASFACVVRDHTGKVLLLGSTLEVALSPEEAKLKALSRAAELLLNFKWSEMIWSSDAQSVVNDINELHEPLGWSTRHVILECRSVFREQDRSLCWFARSSNKVADAVAKLSLVTGANLLFNAASLNLFPSFFYDVVLADLKA